MRVDLIVIDNFYNDPDQIRSFALQQSFDVTGNFPGKRTKPFFNDSMKAVIGKALYNAGGIVLSWNDTPYQDASGMKTYKSYSGSFQICTEDSKTWVHADQNDIWSGVCFLTPNAPSNAGTAFYKHKITGETEFSGREYNWDDDTQWEQTEFIANKYNRLILYRSCLFHAAVNYFGNSLENGRLFQVFFLKTEF